MQQKYNYNYNSMTLVYYLEHSAKSHKTAAMITWDNKIIEVNINHSKYQYSAQENNIELS